MGSKIENVLDSTLRRVQEESRVALMAHLVAGYRSVEESKELACAFAENGADLLEVQIPFSDPTADGPVITAACHKALKAGATPRAALRLAAELSCSYPVPVLIMSYYNLLFRWPGGVEAFVREAQAGGVCGTIVPDLPPEEEQEGYFYACRAAGVHPIVVVSPNVPAARLTALAEVASGMVYATARVGTTGAASSVDDPGLRRFLVTLKQTMKVPVGVGFGIHRRSQIEALAGLAEVAVVGTHLLKALEEGGIGGAAGTLRTLSHKR